MMQEFPQTLIFILFGVIFIALMVFGAIQARRRREAMKKYAASLGCSFSPGKDWSFDEHYSGFGQLRKGSNRYAYNIISGRKGEHDIKVFDYHYETHSTNSKGRRQTHHHYFSAVIYHTGLPVKPLFIRPENFLDKFTEFIGFDDIDFESNEFSSNFYVKAQDKKWAYDVIHQETMEFLLASPRFTIEFETPNIIVYESGTMPIEDFGQAMNVVEGILQRFPDYLLEELKGAQA